MREFFAMLAAFLLVVLLAPPVWAFQLVRSLWRGGFSKLRRYMWAVALGLDQLGGSVIYSRINWTVSGYTGYLASRGYRWARWFERVIDAIFGAGHCRRAYAWDLAYDASEEVRR